MKIENSFTIDAPVEEAWALLTNIPEIAPCLPGAKLSGEEDGVYSGAVKIKVGPVTAEYRGTAAFVERDDANHRAVIDGKGRDSRGAGNAQALITAEMRSVGEQTEVDISTDLKITGKVAQFGRGVMQDVSEKLLGQFAECLATKLEGPAALEKIAEASAEIATPPADEADAAVSESATGASEMPAPDPVAAGTDATNGDDDALDLLDVAGGAVFKRLIPVAVVVVVVVILLIWLLS